MQTQQTRYSHFQNRKKLQRLQNRALRIIYDHRDNLEELHCRANIAALRQRADKQLLNLMYRRSLNPKYPQVMNLSSTTTRASAKIRFDTPRPKVERSPIIVELNYGIDSMSIPNEHLTSSTSKVESPRLRTLKCIR